MSSEMERGENGRDRELKPFVWKCDGIRIIAGDAPCVIEGAGDDYPVVIKGKGRKREEESHRWLVQV